MPPHAACVTPRAAFDDDAELAGSLTVLDALERVAVAERLVLVIDELEKDIDVTLKDSDVLVDAKVQKLWARVSAVGSSFGNKETTQSVEYPLRLGSSADSVELALRLLLLLELVLFILVELELVVVLSLIVVAVELPALTLVVVGDCPWTAATKQSRETGRTLRDWSRISFPRHRGCQEEQTQRAQ
ncbi:hypothetical protein EV421DRAFT_1910473 [Armillaria borealis]|uniref:Uncharacterized protein n=1 Tax=Armillaria borealis TaxID=47425 RepID=A0AA39MG06_9AGAR|nr:hypothetical protein EV421DRAFT_1910473 [Armillaria borealis]